MNATRSRIDAGGRLIIPAQLRRTLGLDGGASVVLTVVDDELRVQSVGTAMSALKARTRRFLASDSASVDAFLSARRADAAAEEARPAQAGPVTENAALRRKSVDG
jgi:AbrB family looped-hinge helix DNA binding protein